MKTRNILITGGTGFIGSNFLKYTVKKKKSPYKIIAPTHKELDILNLEKMKKAFDVFAPEIVINFAAHRNANTAEKQRGEKSGSAWKTNVVGVANLAKVSKEYGSFLIHISTDMVFSGHPDNPGPYDEEALPEKKMKHLSWYGWTKAEAERILKNKKNVAIIRIGNVTQPIYDPKLDYIGKFLYLYNCGKLYPLFHDQYLSLTYVPSIFEVIETIVREKQNGIFHVASKNLFTPYALAEYLIKIMWGKTNVIQRISINEYLKKFPNRYPKYGGLLSEKTGEQLSIIPLSWEKIVNKFFKIKVHSSFDK